MKKNASKSKKNYLLVGVIVLLMALLVVFGIKLYKPSVKEETKKEKTELLFVQTATSGTFIPIAGEKYTFELVLNNAAPDTIYFSDRPERVTGLAPMEDFLKKFNWKGDGDDPPNAALVLSRASENQDVMLLELMEPNYDKANNVLKYKTKTLMADNGSERFYGCFGSRADENISQSFNHVALFIDSEDMPQNGFVANGIGKSDSDWSLPYTHEDWMKNIPDSTKITEISIPGTHDSGSDKHYSQQGLNWSWTITQDFRMDNQLKLGVRWFDIRLCYCGSDCPKVYHGTYYLHKNFTDVINWAIDFLSAHPTETVILMIKQEHSSASASDFSQSVYRYIESHGLQHFYLKCPAHEGDLPTMGELRGKVYIVRRFENGTGKELGPFVTWPDNTKGSLNDIKDKDGNLLFHIYAQDHYSLHTVSSVQKCNEVEETLSHANNRDYGGDSTLFVNYTSGERVPSETIWATANGINPSINSYLLSGDGRNFSRLGVVMMDMAGGGDANPRNCAPDLVETIIKKNPWCHNL